VVAADPGAIEAIDPAAERGKASEA
jgi:hypothetical protein